MRTIAIIGGGLSGSAVALQIIKNVKQKTHLYIIEKDKNKLFRGFAYSSLLPYQLLNVPVGGMSIFENEPDHFYEWIQKHYPKQHYSKADYVSRKMYGDYVESTYQEYAAKSHHKITILNEEVTNILKQEDVWKIDLSKNRDIVFDHLFLCIGNFHPRVNFNITPKALSDPKYVASPWLGENIEKVNKQDRVLIIGMGLSMIDQTISLKDKVDQIFSLSIHGLLPKKNEPAPIYELKKLPSLQKASIIEYTRWFKDELKQAQKEGKNWMSLMNAIRDHISTLWMALNHEEKSRFLRHVRSYWEVHRHRTPEVSYNHLKAMENEGKLHLLKGRIVEIDKKGDIFYVSFKNKDTHKIESLEVNWIINCTGPQSNMKDINSTFLINLFKNKIISQDPLGLGLQTSENGHVINGYGQLEKNAHIIGPPTKGTFWENTAVKEIRKQAQKYVAEVFENELSITENC